MVALLRTALLILIGVDVALIIGGIALYPAFLAQPNALVYALEPIALLAIYAVIIMMTSRQANARQHEALRVGITFGLLTGCLWLLNLTLETFTDLSGTTSILATAPFLLGAFALWGVAGALAAWRTASIAFGTLAGVWSAMICVLLTITYGWILPFVALARLQQELVNDPDFLRSRWTDLHAFVLANSFDAGFSHLLGALIISMLVGAIGGALAVWLKGMRDAPSIVM